MTGPELVERVARAIQAEDEGEGESYASAARAAIRAMLAAIREPSDAMLEMCSSVAYALDAEGTYAAKREWRTMIDALRQEVSG